MKNLYCLFIIQNAFIIQARWLVLSFFCHIALSLPDEINNPLFYMPFYPLHC